MSELLIGVGAKIVSSAVVGAVRGLTRSWQNASPAPKVEPPLGKVIQDQNNETVGVLNQQQELELFNFLQRPEIRSLIQARVLVELSISANPNLDEIEEANSELQARFRANVLRHEFAWDSLADDIWMQVTDEAKTIISAPIESYLSPDELDALLSNVRTTSTNRTAVSSQPLFVRNVLEATSNEGNIKKIGDTERDIRSAMREWSRRARLRHIRKQFDVDLADIYIDRTLTQGSNPTSEVAAMELASPLTRMRAVVLGNPGAGKSTLTQHIVSECTNSQDGNLRLPLLVICKDAVGRLASETFEEIIAQYLRVGITGTETDSKTVSWLLSLGKCLVIFDGIDEILDIGARRDFIRKVEAFANRYPTTSILATSRLVGYDTAIFSAKLFDQFVLKEFDMDQIERYVHSWFTQAAEQDSATARAFLLEGEQLEELLRNPLMLSLLCALYRHNGYIPQSRREVYKDCADLLFHRWDSFRGINSGVISVQQARQLMMALAYWFSNSQAAQSGVPERQVAQTLAMNLRDTAGIIDSEAPDRAREFLEYCAGRAWLLTELGTDSSGERLFGFTHRTFLEYFSAEETVRRTPDTKKLADEIIRIYREDPSSVRAELIFQCANANISGASNIIIGSLLQKSRLQSGLSDTHYFSMLVRLTTAAIVGADTQNKLFDAIGHHWINTDPYEDWATTNAVFSLPRDSRNRFIEGLIQNESPGALSFGAASQQVREAFLDRWARFRLMRSSLSETESWDQCFARLLEEDLQLTYPTLTWAFEAEGYPEPALRFPDGLAFKGIGRLVPGVPLLAWAKVLSNPFDTKWLAQLERVNNDIPRWPQVRRVSANWIASLVEEMDASLRGTQVQSDEHRQSLTPLALWLCAISLEVSKSVPPVFNPVINQTVFRELATLRISSIQSAQRRSNPELPHSAAEWRRIAPWLTRWVSGGQLVPELIAPVRRSTSSGR